MKFTSKDLMKAMGLKVGDRVKTKDNFIFEIVKNNFYILKGINIPENRGLEFLIDLEVDILPRPKRIGDLKCKDFECSSCPIRTICINNSLGSEQDTLFETLEAYKKKDYLDQEIYDILKARLDKEVEKNVD